MTEEKDIPLTTGKVIKVSKDGWGFIVSPSLRYRTIYFHWTALNKFDNVFFEDLRKGAKVEFELVENYIDKVTNENLGPRAFRIQVLENGR